jgi:hypothetical protein
VMFQRSSHFLPQRTERLYPIPSQPEAITACGKIIENRHEDSHDILGPFQAATTAPWRDHPPQSADEFLVWLQNVNALVMQQRADKKPGEWKEKANQAGSTYFVVPELVVGSLPQGFERIRALHHPLAQAIMIMFVVARFRAICAATNYCFRWQSQPPE